MQSIWPEPLAVYTQTLENITDILLANAKQVLYALTTPFQADSLPSCGPYCNMPNTTSSLSALQHYGWPQPTDGGNGRCGPPLCQEGALGCGVPNATAKAQSPDPNAPGCGPPTYAVTVLNDAASKAMASKGVPTLDLNSLVHSHCGANYSFCEVRAHFFPFPCFFSPLPHFFLVMCFLHGCLLIPHIAPHLLSLLHTPFLQPQQLCDNETQYMGIYCGYHYSPIGVSILANEIAETFKQLLGAA